MLDIIICSTAFLFGTLLGSFLNVCVYRLPRGFALHWPPSHCPFCNENVRWYDNAPIVSYLLLGRRCRFCGIRISPRYAVVEGLTGLLFAYLASRLLCGPGLDYARMGVYTVVASALVAASFVDFEFRIIPDEISIPGAVLAPLAALAWPHLHDIAEPLLVRPIAGMVGIAGVPWASAVLASLLGMAAGAGVIWSLGVVGKAIFHKEAMGFGDVKLMAFIGGIAGWRLALLGIMLGACIGAVVGIAAMVRSRDTRMPFGPYLSLGSIIALLHADDLVRLFNDYAMSLQP